MRTIEVKSLKDIKKAARTFLSLVHDKRMFAFYGSMGSGKTTLIKAICKELGATDMVTSPTFALVNEYRTRHGDTIYHLDLYRMNSIGELFDIGYEEYFYGDHIVFIEWPEKAEALLPESIVQVTLEETGMNTRLVHIAI